MGYAVTGAFSLKQNDAFWSRPLGPEIMGHNVLRQEVARAKSLGQIVLGPNVMGQDEGHQ